MKNISFGQYYPAESLIHRLDARAKVILTVLYIVCSFLCKNIISFALLALSAVLLVLLSNIPLRAVLRSIRPIIFVMLFTVVLNIFWTKGEKPLFSWWILTVYPEGIYSALFMLIRILSLIIGTSIFMTYTTTPIALADGMEQLLSPLKKIKLPVHEFSMMMTVALRFIPTLIEETEKIIAAQKARGADFSSGGLIKRAKALIPILIPLVISAFRRADELATAMECRCYRGGDGRTKLHVLRYSPLDFMMMIVVVLLGVILVGFNLLSIGYSM
ncbi:MAG: energy-coupling factor transporter transmembrane protein EcfT [Ruminococcaceae bacterium]|nr:energy-coupling factor transporter transmembrane protein EcfT [Oscillospiraceae bacterium]